jgi:hypothetical protein
LEHQLNSVGGHLRYICRAAIGPEPGRTGEHGAKNLERRQVAVGGGLVLQPIVKREAIDLLGRAGKVGMNRVLSASLRDLT